jgi:hypothetical protein
MTNILVVFFLKDDCVDLEMRRYIVLLLITGIVWAQTDFDKLILKNGTTYFGEYSKTEGDRVYFRIQGVPGFQPVLVKLIQTIELKDGFIVFSDNVKNNSSDFEEYQKLSNKEKANRDRKFNQTDFVVIIGCIIVVIVLVASFDINFSSSGGGFGPGLI